MKIIKNISFLALFSTLSFCGETIDILNRRLDFNSTETLLTAKNKIYEETGYKVVLAIPNCYIDTNKTFKVSDLPDIGSVLKRLYSDCDGYPSVVKSRKTIIIKKTIAKKWTFDPSWPIVTTKKALTDAYPNISFKIDGKGVIYAYGSNEDIESIEDTMETIKSLSTEEVVVYFDIAPYNTNTKDDTFIGFQKYDPFIKISGDDISLLQVRLKHNTPTQINTSKRIIDVRFDAVHNIILFDETYALPLNKLNELGYVFTGSDNRKWIITVRDFK